MLTHEPFSADNQLIGTGIGWILASVSVASSDPKKFRVLDGVD
jgi:hypothetical protein